MSPKVNIENPTPQQLVAVSQPMLVAGIATGVGGAEPSLIDSVTVSVAGAAPVAASFKRLPTHGTAAPTVSYSATVPFPSLAGDVGIVVTAKDDMGVKATASVTVIGHEPAATGLTPQSSLQVFGTNPAPPFGGDWATTIVKDDRSPAADLPTVASAAISLERGDQFPICSREWTQVTAPAEDYDEDAVVLSGWMLEPELSGADVQFTHPFGNDWECMVALDSEYTGLLAAGNAVPDGSDGAEAMAAAQGLNIPVPAGGLLAIETDGNCVPKTLDPSEDNIVVGDRIAALGRWIVDTGHEVGVGSGSSYRAEMHPPMLMAIGGNRADPVNGALTRVLLTSRPYLVAQVFTTDTGSIYDDDGSNDGTFLSHMNNEIEKLGGLIPSSLTIEAHPKIASNPFKGVHLFHIRVRPPAGRRVVGPVVPEQIQVSFQFTCRSGVGVEVVAAADGVDVVVVLNSDGYTAPALPTRQTRTVTKSQLGHDGALITLEQFTSLFQGIVSVVVEEQALARGIETDTYNVPDVNILDRSHAVPFVPISNIPAGGAGITVNDTQPYPIYGFVEVRSVLPIVHPIADDTHSHSRTTHNAATSTKEN